jgi:hypothetical protein
LERGKREEGGWRWRWRLAWCRAEGSCRMGRQRVGAEKVVPGGDDVRR